MFFGGLRFLAGLDVSSQRSGLLQGPGQVSGKDEERTLRAPHFWTSTPHPLLVLRASSKTVSEGAPYRPSLVLAPPPQTQGEAGRHDQVPWDGGEVKQGFQEKVTAEDDLPPVQMVPVRFASRRRKCGGHGGDGEVGTVARSAQAQVQRGVPGGMSQ